MLSNSLKKVKEIFDKGYNLVIMKDDAILTSKEPGIKTLLKVVASNKDCSNAYVADKIVGKAAALLYAKLKVKEVFTVLTTFEAVEILRKYNIEYYYYMIVDNIKDRKFKDICPMEKAVLNVNNPSDAYDKLLVALEQLKCQNNK